MLHKAIKRSECLARHDPDPSIVLALEPCDEITHRIGVDDHEREARHRQSLSNDGVDMLDSKAVADYEKCGLRTHSRSREASEQLGVRHSERRLELSWRGINQDLPVVCRSIGASDDAVWVVPIRLI